LDLDDTPGTNERVMLPHPAIIEASEVGHELLIDDGKMKLEVIGTGDGYLDCKVVVAGRIKDRKVSSCDMLICAHMICSFNIIISIIHRESTHQTQSLILAVLLPKIGKILTLC